MNIAIIPARHGSKSILNKNLQKIGSKSLVHRTIQSALDSGIFSQIILTTDIPTLIDEYRQSKAVITRSRPKNLCQDDTPMHEVAIDAMDAYGVWPENRIWLLQPTAPFRQLSDYQRILELFQSEDTRSVISVFDVASFHPNRMYKIINGRLYPIKFTSFKNKQELPSMHQRSGHFYVCGARDLRLHKTFFLRPCKPYVVERIRGLANIDDPLDLKIAQLFYKEGLCL